MSMDQRAAMERETAVAAQGTTRRGETMAHDVDPQLVEADLLVEEVSIDGMCGVY